MSDESLLGRLKKVLAKPDDVSESNKTGTEDAKVASRRRFLQGVAGAGVTIASGGGAPAEGVGKLLSQTAVTSAAKTALDKLGEEAQEQSLKKFSNEIGGLIRQFVDYGDVAPGGAELMEKGVTGPILPDSIRTMDWRHNLRGMFGDLPQDMKLGELLGDDIKNAFEGMMNENGSPILQNEQTRKALVEKIQTMTGLGESATFGDINKAYRKRVSDISREIFEKINDPTICDPKDRRAILNNLRETMRPDSPEDHKVFERIDEEYRKVEKEFSEKWKDEIKQKQEEQDRQRRENLAERFKTSAKLSDLPDEPGTFELHLFVEERDLKHIRKLEKTDIYQLMLREWPEIQPHMMNVKILKDGAIIESKNAHLTQILYEMTRREDPIPMTDRLDDRPLWNVE